MPSRGAEDSLLLHFRPDQSVAEALAAMARAFGEVRLDSPQRDARFLLQGLLGIDGAQLLSASQHPLGEAAAAISAAANRRLAHEPVSRILGRREFYGREFIVTPDVLDPRPDTEAVVDLALEVIKSSGLSGRALAIADIGTGSGILICTLLAELPEATGVATDVSVAALEVARRNAEKRGVADRIRFVATSGLSGCGNAFDLVVSNPPYIREDEIAELDPEVKDYDPRLALCGGTDGLDIYREIARNTLELLRPVRLVLEVGSTQAEAVEELFAAAGARSLGRRLDLGGHTRAVAMEIHL